MIVGGIEADRAAVEQVLAGDIGAFAGIVHRWQRPLVNLAYRFCGDRGRAEDMAQEAFLRAYRALGQWRRDAAFSTWLFALAANLYRSELRRNPPPAVALDRVAEPRDRGAQDGGLEERDAGEAVRQMVSVLPAKYREVLVLYYFHEMDIESTGRSLGISSGTVKARLWRGRELLREKLSRQPASRSKEEKL